MLWASLAADAAAQTWFEDFFGHRKPSFTEEGAASCYLCHAGESMRAMSDSVHGNPDNPLSPAALQECESCHGPGSIHISRAHGGRGFPPLIVFGYGDGAASRDAQVGACMYCHDGHNGTEAVIFEGTVHDRMTVNCSACHRAHVRSDPVMERGSQAPVCLACHKAQEQGHPLVGRKVPDFSRMGCAGCHRVHRLPKNPDGGG
jgi:predicted CXXCH cytochrome family protein